MERIHDASKTLKMMDEMAMSVRRRFRQRFLHASLIFVFISLKLFISFVFDVTLDEF
jgi:hypothetical protein